MAIAGGGVTTPGPYNERLMSLPPNVRKTTAGDGTEPGGGAQSGNVQAKPAQQPQTADEQAAQPPAFPKTGRTLKDAEPKIKFLAIEQLIRSQDPLARSRYQIDTYHRRVRRGVPFGRLEKIPNQSVWVAKLPNGMSKESSAAVPNKADDLCNKVEDTLMADPAKIIAKPSVTDESATAAGKLASRWLSDDGGQSGTDDIGTYRWALNNAFTAAASFLHYRADRTGGGYQPLRVLAHPQAQDPQNPRVAQIPGPPDAMTGLPTTIEEESPNPILRYVSAPTSEAPAGQFVEDATQADKVWVPRMVTDRLRREQVRTFPPEAPIERAKAAAVILNIKLADARSLWPDTVGQMDMTQLLALTAWKPTLSDQTIPFMFRALADSGSSGPSLDDVGSFSPLLQRRMFAYLFYVGCSPEYDTGYWVAVNGASGGSVLGEGDLEYTVKLPSGGKETRCRDIPLVMIRPMQDVEGGDPTGWPFISRFAGSSEATATLMAAFMDVCDNMLHPHVYIGSTVSIDEDEWFDRSMPIMLNPDDKPPTYEEFPTLPPILPLVQELHKQDDTVSGLTATAQGLDSSNATSGTAKNATIRQALISLSGFQQNLQAAQTRGARIKCQIVQDEWSTPQLMEATGEAGSFEPEWWTGENFAAVEDRLGLQPGTGTMMTPEGKAQYIAFLQQQRWMQPDEGAEIVLPGIRMDLGLPENPFEQAIERSIGVFMKGPPQGWLDMQKAYLAAVQAYQVQQAQIAQEQQAQAAKAQADAIKAQGDQQQGNTMALADQKHRQAMEMHVLKGGQS